MRKIAALASLVFLFSCGDKNGGQTVDSNANDSVNVVISRDTSWKALTESWNASLNLRDASIMKSFYADSVLYYGDHLSADEVVHRQQEYFAMTPDYKQKIVEYIDEIQQPDGSWLIKIVKQVTAGGKTNNYPASLVFAKVNGIWKLIAESDDITDLNKARSIEVKYKPEQTTIEGLLEENNTFGSAQGGDPKSDSKIPYYVVWSKYPLDVVATGDQEKQGWTTEHNVERVQLIGDQEQIKKLLNRKVRVTGTLEHASTEKHYTKVVMNVQLVEEVL